MKWAVVFFVHVHTPHRHFLTGIVENVPKNADKEDVKEAVERAGYQPGEFGILWANHYVIPLKDANSQVVGAYRQHNYKWSIDYAKAMEPIS